MDVWSSCWCNPHCFVEFLFFCPPRSVGSSHETRRTFWNISTSSPHKTTPLLPVQIPGPTRLYNNPVNNFYAKYSLLGKSKAFKNIIQHVRGRCMCINRDGQKRRGIQPFRALRKWHERDRVICQTLKISKCILLKKELNKVSWAWPTVCVRESLECEAPKSGQNPGSFVLHWGLSWFG